MYFQIYIDTCTGKCFTFTLTQCFYDLFLLCQHSAPRMMLVFICIGNILRSDETLDVFVHNGLGKACVETFDEILTHEIPS